MNSCIERRASDLFASIPSLWRSVSKILNLDDSEDGTFVSFARLHINVDPLTSIIKRAMYVKEISLAEPGVRIRVLENGELNFADLMNEEDPEPVEPDNADSGELPTVLIGNVAIENGRIEFLDDSKTDPFRVEIAPLNISASGFGTHSHTAAPYQIGAAIKDGATLRWSGDFSVEPLQSHGTLELESLRLTRLWSYLADLLNFQILAGTASLNAQYTFDSSGDDVLLTIEDGTLTTDGVEIGAKGATNPDLTLPSFAVRDIAYDLTTNSVTISEIESTDGRIGIVISEDGIVNIQPLFAPCQDNAPEATEQAAAPQADATVGRKHTTKTRNRLDRHPRLRGLDRRRQWAGTSDVGSFADRNRAPEVFRWSRENKVRST